MPYSMFDRVSDYVSFLKHCQKMTSYIFSHLVVKDEKIKLSLKWKNLTCARKYQKSQRNVDFRKILSYLPCALGSLLQIKGHWKG